MIVALLVVLAGTCATGYMMTTDAYWGSKLIEHAHEFTANPTVGRDVAHVLGVLIASFEHRENLFASMISGRKRSTDLAVLFELNPPELHPTRSAPVPATSMSKSASLPPKASATS